MIFDITLRVGVPKINSDIYRMKMLKKAVIAIIISTKKYHNDLALTLAMMTTVWQVLLTNERKLNYRICALYFRKQEYAFNL